MEDCIFCKIIKNEIPCYKIYEDENVLAFLDIASDVYGHTLVIPKIHFENVLDCDEKSLNAVMSVTKKIAKHYVDNCGFEGVNILNASGSCAQQSVFHLHFHIIPRKKSDGINSWPKFEGTDVPLNEVQKLLKI